MISNSSAKRAFWRVMKINAFGATEKKNLLDFPQQWFSDLPDHNYSNPLICVFAIDRIYFLLEQLNRNIKRPLIYAMKFLKQKLFWVLIRMKHFARNSSAK